VRAVIAEAPPAFATFFPRRHGLDAFIEVARPDPLRKIEDGTGATKP
jgi:hypothetical protein